MPALRLVCMIEGIWKVFPSRIRLAMAGMAEQHLFAAHSTAADPGHNSARAMTPFERLGKHDPDLGLPVGRELVDDPIHRSRQQWSCAGCRRPGALSRRVSIAMATVSRSRISPTMIDVGIFAQRRPQRVA